MKLKALLFLILLPTLSWAQTDPNLVSWWKLDDGAGVVATDSSGSNDGTLTGFGDPNAAWVTGFVGDYAIDFNGVGDYVDIDSSVSSVASDTTGSITAWFKTTATGAARRIFSVSDKSDPSSDLGINQLDVGDAITFGVRDGGVTSLDVRTVSTYNDGEWHLFTVSVGSTGNTLYIDGSTVSVSYSTGTSATQKWFADVADLDTMRIGNNEDSGGNQLFWDGQIDDVRIYNRSLDANEVRDIYIEAPENLPVGWDYIGTMTIDANYIGTGGVTGWTVFADANMLPSNAASVVQADGEDIRFSLNNEDPYGWLWADPCGYSQEGTIPFGTTSLSSVVNNTIYVWGGNSAAEAQTTTAVYDANMVACWRFYEGTGTTLTDSTDNDNDGTINGATWTTGRHGYNVLDFNGTSDYVGCGNDDSLKFGGEDFSVACWVNTAAAGTEGVIGYGDRGDDKGWTVVIKNTVVEFILDDGTTQVVCGLNGDYTGEWVYIACVADRSGDGTVYVNDSNTSSTDITSVGSITSSDTNDPVEIGRYKANGSPTNYFDGQIDDVIIWDRALTAGEVETLYNNFNDPASFGSTTDFAEISPSTGGVDWYPVLKKHHKIRR